MDPLRVHVMTTRLTAAMWSLASLSILKRRCSDDIVYLILFFIFLSKFINIKMKETKQTKTNRRINKELMDQP